MCILDTSTMGIDKNDFFLTLWVWPGEATKNENLLFTISNLHKISSAYPSFQDIGVNALERTHSTFFIKLTSNWTYSLDRLMTKMCQTIFRNLVGVARGGSKKMMIFFHTPICQIAFGQIYPAKTITKICNVVGKSKQKVWKSGVKVGNFPFIVYSSNTLVLHSSDFLKFNVCTLNTLMIKAVKVFFGIYWAWPGRATKNDIFFSHIDWHEIFNEHLSCKDIHKIVNNYRSSEN